MTKTDRHRFSWWVVPPAGIAIAIACYSFYAIADQQSPKGDPTPVDIAAESPEFATLDELEAASDLVVRGRVEAIGPGRALTDPADPTAGIRTQLATVFVTSSLKGDAAGERVVIEQEATLLDGTPITVNGVAPLQLLDEGTFYLVQGDGDQFPYTALTTVDGFVPAP